MCLGDVSYTYQVFDYYASSVASFKKQTLKVFQI